MKALLFLICLTVSVWVTAGAGGMQAGVLKTLAGASDDLNSKLKCLKAQRYPSDIEKCGLSGFVNPAHQKKVEDCLWSETGKLFPLKVARDGQYVTVMLVVSCRTIKVAAEFDAIAGKYSLVYIGELLD